MKDRRPPVLSSHPLQTKEKAEIPYHSVFFTNTIYYVYSHPNMAPETCTFNGLFPPTFTSTVSRGGAPLMQRAETGSYGAKCCTVVHIRSSAEVKGASSLLGSKGQLRRCSELRSLVKTVQIIMAVVIRIISVTLIIVCCEHVLGQSLSLGKCPSYPAIKKLDLKKVCTIKLVYFIFLIQ